MAEQGCAVCARPARFACGWCRTHVCSHAHFARAACCADGVAYNGADIGAPVPTVPATQTATALAGANAPAEAEPASSVSYVAQRGVLSTVTPHFRHMGMTTQSLQTAFMSFPPGTATPPEVHALVDQLFIVLPNSGPVVASFDGVVKRFMAGDTFIVKRHTRHVVGAGPDEWARVYTVYSEPRHAPTVVQATVDTPEQPAQPDETPAVAPPAQHEYERDWIAFDDVYEKTSDLEPFTYPAIVELSLALRALETRAIDRGRLFQTRGRRERPLPAVSHAISEALRAAVRFSKGVSPALISTAMAYQLITKQVNAALNAQPAYAEIMYYRLHNGVVTLLKIDDGIRPADMMPK